MRLNRAQCERFLNPESEFFAPTRNSYRWYDKSEFFHESELVPLEQWTTRYIYVNSFPSMVGSELMPRGEEHAEDRARSYWMYSQQQFRRGLHQFSDDGYYHDLQTGIRWRIMRNPYRPADDPTAEFTPLTLVDESGQYMPRGLPGISVGSSFGYRCDARPQGGYACGFVDKDPTVSVRWIGAINKITPELSALKVEPNQITITQRVSHGEPFVAPGIENDPLGFLFFYATFEDPIRPVYFAPGLILKDEHILQRRKRPRNSDFVQHAVCLTDCPADLNWQLSSRRRFDQSHP